MLWWCLQLPLYISIVWLWFVNLLLNSWLIDWLTIIFIIILHVSCVIIKHIQQSILTTQFWYLKIIIHISEVTVTVCLMTLFLHTHCHLFLTMASQNSSFSAFITTALHSPTVLFCFWCCNTFNGIGDFGNYNNLILHQMSCLSWHIIMQIGHTIPGKKHSQ